MKRNRRRLPLPQHEFAFAPAAFNLMIETGLDRDRITRERTEADRARHQMDEAQVKLFPVTLPTVSESASARAEK